MSSLSEVPGQIDERDDEEEDDVSVFSRMVPTRDVTPMPVRHLDARASTPLSNTPSDLFSGDYDLEDSHPELEPVTMRNPFEGLALPTRHDFRLPVHLELSQPPAVGHHVEMVPPVEVSDITSVPVSQPSLIVPHRPEQNVGVAYDSGSVLQDAQEPGDGISPARGPTDLKAETLFPRIIDQEAESTRVVTDVEAQTGQRFEEEHVMLEVLRSPSVTEPTAEINGASPLEREKEFVAENMVGEPLSDALEIVPHHHGPSIIPARSETQASRTSSSYVGHRPLTRAQCHWEKIRVTIKDTPSRVFFVTICNINEAQELDGIIREGPAVRSEWDQALEEIPPLIAEGMADVLAKLEMYIGTSPLGAARWLPVAQDEVEGVRAEFAKLEYTRKVLKRPRTEDEEGKDSSEPLQKKPRTPTPLDPLDTSSKISSEPRRTRLQLTPSSNTRGKGHQKSLSVDGRLTPTREIPDVTRNSSSTIPRSSALSSSPGLARYPLRSHDQEEHEEHEERERREEQLASSSNTPSTPPRRTVGRRKQVGG
ncbi:hypothetical protein DACRYDRAFT_24855 [Dacryopinax primogenitus]|uniref:Uncharacterized protein n=1 Tax=Dacryopinax primogenitus (strain DJM 731) TaxID=1858805 RepID=M5FQT6_DACPD|nr:uncharacterized protein DACRYDRAFT_24855 [Dacryopinax primogenitus]EJT97938.1 hypothetical protein DACRYDRAFT_24855 [Dacryopinax primogenitus]